MIQREKLASHQEESNSLITFCNSPSLGNYAFRPGDPNPDLLTVQEAIRYLRLDQIRIKNPKGTLEYYRKQGILKATQVSKCVFYLRPNLDAFLQTLTQSNSR